MVSVTAPSILLIVDDSIDISFLYDISEEEEEKGKEKNKEFEIIVLDLPLLCEDYFNSENEEDLGYFFKKYSKPHLNLIFPPPEHYIL